MHPLSIVDLFIFQSYNVYGHIYKFLFSQVIYLITKNVLNVVIVTLSQNSSLKPDTDIPLFHTTVIYIQSKQKHINRSELM